MIERIVSGGQTGADRAALDFAIAAGIPHGGWCPKGRLAEDGPIDPRYQLVETPEPKYAQRTEWNARDSDGTVILSHAAQLSGGSALTVDLARLNGKPCLCLSRAEMSVENAAAALQAFIEERDIRTLNVAGPRASNEPEVGAFVKDVLEAALRD